MHHGLIIFDADQSQLGPVDQLRPIMIQRFGVWPNIARIERRLAQRVDVLWPAKRHVGIAIELCVRPDGDNPAIADQTAIRAGRNWLWVSGRCMSHEWINRARELTPGSALVDTNNAVVAAMLDHDQALAFARTQCRQLPEGVDAEPVNDLPPLAVYPWDILDQLTDVLAADLALADGERLNASEIKHRYNGVHVAGDAAVIMGVRVQLDPGVVLVPEQGPILIEDDTRLMPGAVVHGPCVIGKRVTVASHTVIRPGCVIGGYCKVGGEISASVLQHDTNKSHFGYLGNSLVGSWTNLGAGTCVSNLKNTYGLVRLQLHRNTSPVKSTRQFHGPVIGDYVRTAIGTRLMTGSVVEGCCCLATSTYSPKFVPSFSFMTDRGNELYDLDRLVDSIDRAMERRNMTVGENERAALAQLHKQYAQEPSLYHGGAT